MFFDGISENFPSVEDTFAEGAYNDMAGATVTRESTLREGEGGSLRARSGPDRKLCFHCESLTISQPAQWRQQHLNRDTTRG